MDTNTHTGAKTMNAANTARQHSTTLTAQCQAHLASRPTMKGYASKASALRALSYKLQRVQEDGLSGHFALVEITDGRNAGRFYPTLGFEVGCPVSPEVSLYSCLGFLCICAA
jgi:hypothetical protein